MNWQLILLIVAVILFALEALGIGNGKLTPAGLAFFAGAFLVAQI